MITNQFIFDARIAIVACPHRKVSDSVLLVIRIYQYVAISVDYHVLFKVDI